MSGGVRIALAFVGPFATVLLLALTNERPLDDVVQLMSASFGVAGVVLGVGYAVRRLRGPGIASVAITSAIGVALVWLALFVSAAVSADVRAWLLVLLLSAPAFAFPSIFGAALATCAGRAPRPSSPSRTAS